VPWRGPQEEGEFPTLGYAIGEWIEAHCIIPDGPKLGQPYLLTDEMWLHLLWSYRLHPDAPGDAAADAHYYRGDQLVRPQKWGKDPFNAARCSAHALGPVQFGGWDAQGEPVAVPHPSPWVGIAATTETQTDNTFRPLYTMLTEGPLADTPGLDVGLAEIKLPGVGWIDPLTSSASGKLGGRFTYVSLTEPGLLVGTGRTGGVTFARVLKRNVGGMNGMWSEITNPWDPTENSASQLTYEAKAPDVYINFRQPRRRVELADTEAVLREIIYLYGDSIRDRGGWVSPKRILADVQDSAAGEAEVRRFFLQEIIGGTRSAVTEERWRALARTDDPLRPKESVALGFDGSRSRDATAIRICRLRDGRLFHGRVWIPEDHGGKVPRLQVHQAFLDYFEVYDVHVVFADPYKWQEYLDVWSGLWPNKIVEFPTNVERRMDEVVQRFLTGVDSGELTHDGNELSTRHALDAALVKGKRKPGREGDEKDGVPQHYLSVGKKRSDALIDDFVAGLLAGHARGYAIEHGALVADNAPPAAVRVEQTSDATPHNFWRPSGRLDLG
jgi:hypothetical protein